MRMIYIAIAVLLLTACVADTPLKENYLELTQRHIIERDLTQPYGVDNPNIDKSQTAVIDEDGKSKEIDADSKELEHER